MTDKKVVVLFSGGQDSTTCLLWAIKEYGSHNVHAISFDYGQKHLVELEQARKILELFPSIKHKIFNVEGCFPESALTNHSLDVSGQSDYQKELPASFTPGRNILFLTIAGSYAASLGITEVVTGVCQTDFSGYPDCRRDFVVAMQYALHLGLNMPILIITPLMYLTKAETWKMAAELGTVEGLSALEIVRTMTMTDYNGDLTENEWGYGKEDNPATILRAKGYREAKEKGWLLTNDFSNL